MFRYVLRRGACVFGGALLITCKISENFARFQCSARCYSRDGLPAKKRRQLMIRDRSSLGTCETCSVLNFG